MRQEQKQATREKILDTAASRFRAQGYNATGISEIMQGAELTNGAFYAHFSSKEELLTLSAEQAAKQMRMLWTSGLEDLAPAKRVPAMLERYMSHEHRDNPDVGCTLPTLGADIARQGEGAQQGFKKIITLTLQPLVDDLSTLGANEPEQTAWSILSLCAGAILLARAIQPSELSDTILADALANAKIMVAAATSTGQ